MTNESTRDELIRRVRDIGESIIKNAESIVGTEKYKYEIHIFADVGEYSDFPCISVEKKFLPERYIDKNGENDEI